MSFGASTPKILRPNGQTVEQPQCTARYPHGPDGVPVRCDGDRDHKQRLHAAALPPRDNSATPRLCSWV